MLDITLRPLKDHLFDPLCTHIPPTITPHQITLGAFLIGLLACLSAATNNPTTSLIFWTTNRALDCLDGALARHRHSASALGGFLDLLGDFVVYSGIPISCALSSATDDGGGVWRLWVAVALVEASFHVNNFVLFYAAAVLETRKREDGQSEGKGGGRRKTKKLTSVMMRPALIEGTESAVLFTLMLWQPAWTGVLCWVMAGLVSVGICQRVVWLVSVL